MQDSGHDRAAVSRAARRDEDTLVHMEFERLADELKEIAAKRRIPPMIVRALCANLNIEVENVRRANEAATRGDLA